jgi:oligoribonuclease NrnB/cAMP/cGMP phosphodiesterase (DHH superfamily)
MSDKMTSENQCQCEEESSKEVLCCYHRVDFDGRLSGYLVGRWAATKGHSITYLGVNYNEPFDTSVFKDKLVVICDFTFTPKQMSAIKHCAYEVIWLDHHKTSLDAMDAYNEQHDLENIFLGIQKVGLAGCALTWLYFNGHSELPRLVHLISTYDVWDLRSNDWADALDLQYALKQFELLPDNPRWDTLLNNGTYLEEMVKSGPSFKAYTDQNSKWYLAEYGYEAQFKDERFRHLTVIAMNSGWKGSNYFVDRMGNYDVLFAYVHLPTGEFGVSVYSATGTDVSEIATAFGGGGHKGASGFKCKELPIIPKGGGC